MFNKHIFLYEIYAILMEIMLKFQVVIEIKSPADKFFKGLSKELYHVPNVSDIVHRVEVHEGDFETHGSTKSWTFRAGK